MADLISEIVSQEAFEQVRKLTADLNLLTETMDKAIATGAGNNKMIDANSVKAANDAVANLTATTNKLVETESERLNIERQIKAEGDKMQAAVKVQSSAIDEARKKYEIFANSQSEMAKRIVEAKQELKELQQTLKDNQGAANFVEFSAKATLRQAELREQIAENTKELKRSVIEQKFAGDSMKGMSNNLNQLRDLYKMFTEEERNSDFGKTMLDGINQLDEKIKGLDATMGLHGGDVGNYRLILKELKNELITASIEYEKGSSVIKEQELKVRQLTAEKGLENEETKEAIRILSQQKEKYKQLGVQINDLQQRGGELKDTIMDVNNSLKSTGDDAAKPRAVAESIGVLANSYAIVQGGMAAFGVENKSLMESYAKLMMIQEAANAITEITNALQKDEVIVTQAKLAWAKIKLAFTKKQVIASVSETVAEEANTGAKVENVSATTGAAVATGGLAAAESVATKTSWTLTGSLKAVGLAIKSIPVIGWILGAVAALATLTILLYKHISAEKELTAEQKMRQQLAKDNSEIALKTNENTLETVTRVRLLTKELVRVKQGSQEYKDIVTEINELTGLQFDTIKGMPKEIVKGTEKWIEQYKLRAKAEATIQKIVQNELEYEKNRAEFLASGTDYERREELAKTFNLTDKEIALLTTYRRQYMTTSDLVKKQDLYNTVLEYLDAAKQKMIDNNKLLERQITLEGMTGGDKATKTNKTNKGVDKLKEYQTEILKLKNELYSTAEDLIINNTSIELALSEKKYKEELDQLKEKNKSTEELTKLHQLEIQKIQRDGFAKLQDFRQKNFENIVAYRIKEEEELQKQKTTFIETAQKATEGAQVWFNKFLQQKQKEFEEERKILLMRLDGTNELINSFSSLGQAIASNIKDEKERIIVEQRVTEIQLALTQALAIASVLLDEGDPYLKAIRIAANLAVVVAGFVQAEAAISKAKTAAYAEGTDYHKGGAAIVGEGGQPELIQIGNRTTWITEPTYIPNLPVGASVTPLSDMKQDSNMNDYWLEQIATGSRASVNIDVSGRLLPALHKDMKTIRFANKLIQARG